MVHLVQAMGGAGLLAVGYSLVLAYVVAMLGRWARVGRVWKWWHGILC